MYIDVKNSEPADKNNWLLCFLGRKIDISVSLECLYEYL